MEDQRDNPNIIGSEIIIYQTEDGYTKIDVKFVAILDFTLYPREIIISRL